MADGYYRMHRGWMDDPLFAGERFTKAQAWVWLIENANYRDTKYADRGTLRTTVRQLAEAWQWSTEPVHRFLKRLLNNGKIQTEAKHRYTVITICNYDKYQSNEAEEKPQPQTQPKRNPNATQTLQKERRKKKEDTEELRSSDYQRSDDFATWYAQYPRRRNRGDAEKAYAKAIKKTPPAELMAGAMRYAAWCDRTGQDPDYIPYPATWLNRQAWRDELPEKIHEPTDRERLDAAERSIVARLEGHRPEEAEDNVVDLEAARGGGGEYGLFAGGAEWVSRGSG